MAYGQMDENATRSGAHILRSEEAKKLRRDVQRVKELVAKGLDAEPEYVEFINQLNPRMNPKERKKLIMQFRDAVYDQQPDLPHR